MLYPVELRAPRLELSHRPRPLTTARRNLVGVEGFEPPTSCSQSRRATRLRYTPVAWNGAMLLAAFWAFKRPLTL